MVKKLIEVSLPLEEINAAAAREKSIRHGHPSTLHLWWARRPLAAARAVIWASLVDDPSSHPEKFPTAEEQKEERERLFNILRELVIWENSNNETVLAKAKAEIMKSTHNNPPALLDPFAGGGAIPLEAQRLGLEAHAHDLNPVAVMINKAMIEIPPRFANMPPVNPEAKVAMGGDNGWSDLHGLAEDVEYYGNYILTRLQERRGRKYECKSTNSVPIAWIWTRTVKCPNPACNCEMPLASSFVLSRKKGREAYVEPVIEGKNLRYKVKKGKCVPNAPKMGRGSRFKCIFCEQTTSSDYVRSEAQNCKLGRQLMAIACEGVHGKEYYSATLDDIKLSEDLNNEMFELGKIATNPRWFSHPIYGTTDFKQMFTDRQLITLIESERILGEVRKLPEVTQNGEDYADALCVYLV